MMVMFFATLVIVGLCLGSFVNALVWRLYEQIGRGRTAENLSILHGRSMCPNCHHQLSAKDLFPVLSWLSLRGKCRYCHKSIAWQYPLVELITAGLFVFSYIYWPSGFLGAGLCEFVLWLVFLTGLIALTVYDARWFVLPNRIIYPLIILAAVQLFVVVFLYGDGVNAMLSAFWGIVVIGGLFYVLFQISKGQWIGGGDVKLGVLLGLLIGGPPASILLLFLASTAGTIVALPLLATGKAKRNTHLPFGPFLILSAIIVRLFGAGMITWYKMRFVPF